MSKLNPKNKKDSIFLEERLAGGEGNLAAKQSEINILRRLTLANLLWENIAYADGVSISEEIEKILPLCNPIQVQELALEMRVLQKLRSTPLFLLVIMFSLKGEWAKLAGEILPQICTRADMMSDLVALYWKRNGKKMLPAQMKKGLRKAFNNFSEYELAKYDRNNPVKLRDVLFLCHAKPEQGKEELFRRIAQRELEIPDTWEVQLSKLGNNSQTWVRLIEEKKLGGLAMLRNLRNMQNVNVPREIILLGLERLKGTMLLPLDFLKAVRIVPEYQKEIEKAMIESYKNLPKLKGKTLFIVDVSGSMGSLTSGNSQFSRLDQACAMAMLATNQCENYDVVVTAGIDGNRTGAHEHIKNPNKGFDLFKQIIESRRRVGSGGIFTRQCLEWCYQNVGQEYERIIIFSDSQDCDHPDKRIPNPFGTYNYICDVSNHKYGINYKGIWTAEISGWSEKFLTYIAAYEGVENVFE